MKIVDHDAYLFILKELIESGKEVSLLISGSSMSPFLIHHRDMIWIKKPDRDLHTGDMVFYQRKTGAFVMHRIHHRDSNGLFWIIGDAQTEMEPVEEECIFGLITKVQRKGKQIMPGDFWWEFFEHIWIRMVPMRRWLIWAYGKRKK